MKIAIIAVLALATMPSVHADEIVVLSAAAVRPALIDLPPLHGKTVGHSVAMSFGNATAIQDKVIAGARVDVVILPPPQLDGLIQGGFLVESSRRALGVVRLGVAGRAGGVPPPVGTPDEFRRSLLSASSFGMPDPADGSTSSTYLEKLMQQLGIADEMRAKTKLFADGTKALEAVAKGEIALAIAPITSIRVVAGTRLIGPLPESLQLKTVYAAALTTKSVSSEAANALMTILTSAEFAAVLKQKGIDPP
jgi:molybdate transport system substrate-binding protein